MTHPFIKASKEYLKAQAAVLYSAEAFVAGKLTAQDLARAVDGLQKARKEHKEEKEKVENT